MNKLRWLLVVWTLGMLPAHAHWADLAVAEVSVGEREAQMTLTFPTGLMAFADDDKNGNLSAAEVAKHQAELQAKLGEKIALISGGEAGQLTAEAAASRVAEGARITPNTHSTVVLKTAWQEPIGAFKIRYELFVPGVSTASAVTTVLRGGRVQNVVFTPEKTEYLQDSSGRSFDLWSFFVLGMQHILEGWDHLLFLLALLMLGGSLGYLLKVITAFTVAHSITLFLTASGVINLPGQLVESGIALSIAWVAAENLFRRDPKQLERSRWVVTFFFGLLHGMGFAGILGDIGLPKDNLLGSVLGFNLGVEAGQLVFVIPVFLLLWAIRRIPWEARVRWAVSAATVGAGLYWFVERAFLGA